ncbi:MAG: DUF2062 domain-containing protein [Planctomycetes bacterium]|nr:DUF2062 domain-containing protein [Planctomycetota bacterium]
MASVRHRGVVGRVRQAWRAFALAVRRVVMLEDDPERIARGCAAGMFTAFLPMLGQTFAGMLLAWAIRGSPLAAMPWSWLTNPLTTVPVWYGCYRLGAALIPGHETMGWDRLRELVDAVQAMSLMDGLLHGAEVLGGVFLPMLLGAVLIGLATAVPTFYLVRRAVRALQARRAARAAHWKSRLVPGRGGATT